MKVMNILNKNYPIIEKDARIKDALSLMIKKNVDRLIVVHKERELYGIITEYDIFYKLFQRKTKRFQPYNVSVSAAATSPVDTIYLTADVKTAAEMMLINGYSSLPVLNNDETLAGLVTKWDIIEILKMKGDRYLNLRIEEVMERVKGRVRPFNRLVQAEATMKASGFNTLVVVDDDNKFIGVITAKDIAKIVFTIKKVYATKYWDTVLRQILVAELVSRSVETLNPDNYIEKAVNIILKRRQKLIPILSENRVVGVISRRHLIRFMLENNII